jgi:hypothetical protein
LPPTEAPLDIVSRPYVARPSYIHRAYPVEKKMIGAERAPVGDIGDLGAPDAVRDRRSPRRLYARYATEFFAESG